MFAQSSENFLESSAQYLSQDLTHLYPGLSSIYGNLECLEPEHGHRLLIPHLPTPLSHGFLSCYAWVNVYLNYRIPVGGWSYLFVVHSTSHA